MHSKPPSLSRFRSPFQRLSALWILRAFAKGANRERFFARNSETGYRDDEIAEFLGLPKGRDGSPANAAHVGPILDRLLLGLERDPRTKEFPRRFQENLDRFGGTLSLSPAEVRVLAFFICLKAVPRIADTWHCLGDLMEQQPERLISRLLDLPSAEVGRILSPNGTLRRCRLLTVSNRRMQDRLTLASDRLGIHLFGERYDPEIVLKESRVYPAKRPELGFDSYPHLRDSLDLLLSYLRRGTDERRRGINIFIHGVPGTGKTQLTRLLGETLGFPVYEVATSDERGEASPAADRLKSLDFADKALVGRPVLLVFDEAEDVFGSGLFDRSVASAHKGWFNSMLERNRWPVFWISNQLRGLDPAFVRRFDFILEVPVAPKSERLRLAGATVGDLVGQPLVERIASEPSIAPAVLSRLGTVVRTAAKSAPRERREAHLLRLLGTTLKVQGHHDPFSQGAETRSCGEFDPALLNTPQDLGAIARHLREEGGSARLCLHGPPGTGKSAFGRWLATELDRPLLAKRASDLLGRYVGESERRIGEAFEEAAREGAVLLLDEVDSFLGTRESMRHSWEVTCVNEMLTRIEVFSGVLVCSTNRLEALDPASLRRFDLKVEFDYLRADQVEALLVSQCRLLGLPEPGNALREDARRLRGATPGDFAAVARRHRFDPLDSGEALLAAVREEIRHREPVRASIGFAGLERLS